MNARGTWRSLGIGFDEAVARLPEVLQKEGFGIITQIDLKETFKNKLGADFRRYRIFGACNPKFALEAVRAEPHIGLLLPCNVVVYERDDGKAELGMIDPMQQLPTDDPRLSGLAKNVAERLERAFAAMEGKP